MGKIILTALLAAAFGGAAVTVGQTYYSTGFQWDFPIGGAFKVTPDLANVWHWEGDATFAGTNVVIDFNGDGISDTDCPDVRVCITDAQQYSLGGTGLSCEISDSSGSRWFLPRGGEMHLTTPIVLPVGSSLTVRQWENPTFGTSRVRLIGRIVNI